MIKAKAQLLAGDKKIKALAAGTLVAGMVAASLMVASPAHASTTFTVNSTGDAPDANTNVAVCDTNVVLSGDQCTLRAALEQANATSGADTIDFDIPGKGVHTISPSSPLPDITDAVTINGYSQPGSSPNTLAKGTNAKLMIELNGTNVGSNSGLAIVASNTVVRGLVINRFGGDGITIDSLVTGSKVEGNFIGTDPSGSQQDLGNVTGGVAIFGASDNTVGGATPAKHNLVSGNDSTGVVIASSGGSSQDNKVEGNLIGTQKDGTTALPNRKDGVSISDAPSTSNIVGGATSASANTIAFNAFDGVAVGEGTGNLILSNSIFSNGGIGIDLGNNGPTANDADDPNTPQVDPDADTGANQLQNKPEVTSAKPITKRVKGKKKRFTSIAGNLNSNPSKTFTVQLFSNPSGTTDEGKTLIGQQSVTTDASGNASFDLSVSRSKAPVGSAITATATNEATGDTSEFSVARQVG